MATKFNKSGLTYWENEKSIGIDFNNKVAREKALRHSGNTISTPNCAEESNWKNLSTKRKIEKLIEEKVKREVIIERGKIKSIHFLGTDICLTGKDIEKYNKIRKEVGRIIQ